MYWVDLMSFPVFSGNCVFSGNSMHRGLGHIHLSVFVQNSIGSCFIAKETNGRRRYQWFWKTFPPKQKGVGTFSWNGRVNFKNLNGFHILGVPSYTHICWNLTLWTTTSVRLCQQRFHYGRWPCTWYDPAQGTRTYYR